MSHAALNPLRAPWPMPRDCCSKTRSIRFISRPSANRSPRPPSFSSARRAATAVRTGGFLRRWSAASAFRSTSRPFGSGRSAGFCISSAFSSTRPRRPQPRLLIVAPLSGHYATLLRGTVEAFLPNHDVYITEWRDARTVPISEGRFDLDDYIDYVISMLHALGGDTHVVAVCQPAVPVIAAVCAYGSGRRSLRAAFP